MAFLPFFSFHRFLVETRGGNPSDTWQRKMPTVDPGTRRGRTRGWDPISHRVRTRWKQHRIQSERKDPPPSPQPSNGSGGHGGISTNPNAGWKGIFRTVSVTGGEDSIPRKGIYGNGCGSRPPDPPPTDERIYPSTRARDSVVRRIVEPSACSHPNHRPKMPY